MSSEGLEGEVAKSVPLVSPLDSNSTRSLSPGPLSLPSFQISPLKTDHAVCDENCKEQCASGGRGPRTRRGVTSPGINDRTALLDRRSSSSASSYGSLNEETARTSSPVIEAEGDGDADGFRGSTEPLIRTDLVCQSPTGGPTYTVRQPPNGLEDATRCPCHEKVKDTTTRKAVVKLVAASVVALLFMMGEVTGGYFANSLAIMTDAAHMLSDFASFLISLFAIWIARRPPSRGMSFGWHRAEVLGAMISVLIIWLLTGVLVYEAVRRVIDQSFEVDADIMLITACVGVFVNVFMCLVLHQHSHGHGGHGHSRKRNRNQERRRESEEEGAVAGTEGLRKSKKRTENINVRAAFIHVIGDLVQSIGVVIAGYIIWFKPSWKLADPICTFLFSILVLISTFNILKDAIRVVMEGTPKHIDYEDVKANLVSLQGVKQAHSLHIWSLTLERTALSVHLVLEPGANGDDVLRHAKVLLEEQHHITHSTIQVESHQEVMDDCTTCQEPERYGVLRGLIPSFLRRKKNSQ